MPSQGQAGLEYLLTYGWALVIIATVVGMLVFLVGSPTSKVSCTSSDPAKFLLKSANIGPGSASTPVAANVVNIQNASGGQIRSVVLKNQTGSFRGGGRINAANSLPPTDANLTAPVIAGGNIYIFPSYANALSANSPVLGQFDLNYTDWYGYSKKVTISCQGKI